MPLLTLSHNLRNTDYNVWNFCVFQKAKSLDVIPLSHVSDVDALNKMLEKLKKEKEIAIDLEVKYIIVYRCGGIVGFLYQLWTITTDN